MPTSQAQQQFNSSLYRIELSGHKFLGEIVRAYQALEPSIGRSAGHFNCSTYCLFASQVKNGLKIDHLLQVDVASTEKLHQIHGFMPEVIDSLATDLHLVRRIAIMTA